MPSKKKKPRDKELNTITTTTYLFKEIKVDTISLFLSDKKVSLFETCRDSCDIHWTSDFWDAC